MASGVLSLTVFDLEIVEQRFEVVLGGEAGVEEVTTNAGPFAKASVVEQFQVIGNDEGHDACREAFLEHDQATDAAIAVLEGMDSLEALVEVDDVLDGVPLDSVVFA